MACVVIARVENEECALRSRLVICQMTELSGITDAPTDAKRSTFIESEMALIVRVRSRMSLTLSAGTRT